MKKLITFKHTQGGFIALFAVLLSMVILAMAVGISSISYKEVLLASSAREGHYALFASDSGIECALYGDLQHGGFGDQNGGTLQSFDCAGTAPVLVNTIGSNLEYNFELSFPGGVTLSDGSTSTIIGTPDRCAKVNVQKNKVLDDGTGNMVSYTVIDSFGYNISCTAVDNLINTKNNRAVERALRVVYPN